MANNKNSMQVIRKFTTSAHSPRADSRGVLYRDAQLDLVYTVHSRELPAGPPSAERFNLIFMHGAQFVKEGWYYWIDKMFELYGDRLDKCIAFDHVQHGDSAVVNENKVGFFVPWDDLGRDAGCVIRDCIRRGEIHRDAARIVIAHSMGGCGAMALSVFDPGLVTALVVIDPVWMGPSFSLRHADHISGKFSRMSYASYKRTRDTFKDLDDYKQWMSTKSVYAKAHPKIFQDILDCCYLPIPGGGVRTKMNRALQAASYYSGMSAVGFGQSLVNRVQCPVFVLHGEIADFNPAGLNEQLEETLLIAERKQILDKSGHLVCYTHPDQCIDAIKDFIPREHKRHLDHFNELEKQWGPTAEQNFLAQIEQHNQGLRSAGFSRL